MPCSSTPRWGLEIGLATRKSGWKAERAEGGEASPCGAEAEAKVAGMGYLGWPQQWDLRSDVGSTFWGLQLIKCRFL